MHHPRDSGKVGDLGMDGHRDDGNVADARVLLEQLIEETIAAEGQRTIWWRDVPVDDSHIGETARLSAPVIRQVLIEAAEEIPDQSAFERKLYVIRRVIERKARAELALPSFSSRTIVYKERLWIFSGKHTGAKDSWGGDIWTMSAAP